MHKHVRQARYIDVRWSIMKFHALDDLLNPQSRQITHEFLFQSFLTACMFVNKSIKCVSCVMTCTAN